jgi:molybdopterin synthase sulfur carrier subunit
VATVGQLAEFLGQRGDAWATELGIGRAVRVAVNQDMADSDTVIRGGEEIAFFPPVTGG